MVHMLPWLLLGLTTYLLAGMVITHYTPLGKKYFTATPTRLIFLWIFPVIGIAVFVISITFFFVVDTLLFGDNDGNPGLFKLFGL